MIPYQRVVELSHVIHPGREQRPFKVELVGADQISERRTDHFWRSRARAAAARLDRQFHLYVCRLDARGRQLNADLERIVRRNRGRSSQ